MGPANLIIRKKKKKEKENFFKVKCYELLH